MPVTSQPPRRNEAEEMSLRSEGDAQRPWVVRKNSRPALRVEQGGKAERVGLSVLRGGHAHYSRSAHILRPQRTSSHCRTQNLTCRTPQVANMRAPSLPGDAGDGGS